MAQCIAKTKSGERCKANVSANGRCPIHEDKNKARELAQKSVQARRASAAEARKRAEILPPKTPADLVSELGLVFAELKNGQMEVAVARTMASVGLVLLKGFELVEIKKQLQGIEDMLRHERSTGRNPNQETGSPDSAA